MNIDCSKYYVEARSLDDYKKVAYKNGEKLENNKELADTVVVYDFGQGEEKVTLNSKEEFSQVMKDINTRHGDGVMVSISGLGLNFLKINKGSLNSKDILPKSIETT